MRAQRLLIVSTRLLDTVAGADWPASGRRSGSLERAVGRAGRALEALWRPARRARMPQMSVEWLAEHERQSRQLDDLR